MKHNNLQSGYSLIELMVGITVGMFILLGVVTIYAQTTSVSGTQKQISRVQQKGRLAGELIARDFMLSGSAPCPVKGMKVINTVQVNGVAMPLSLMLGLQGYAANDTGHPSVKYADSTDAVVISYSPPSDTADVVIEAHDPQSMTMTLSDNFNWVENGSPITTIAPDCSYMATFVKDAASKDKSLGHSQSVPTDSEFSNCHTDISGDGNIFGNTSSNGEALRSDCLDAAAAATSNVGSVGTSNNQVNLVSPYIGGSVINFDIVEYYIDESVHFAGVPSLYRRVNGTAQELVVGVEDIQINYGWRDGSGGFQFGDAASVTDWPSIYAVQIDLLLRDITGDTSIDDYELSFGGQDTTYTDGVLRRVFSSQVYIRNSVNSGNNSFFNGQG